jgi:hypothetical protein
MLDKIFQYDPSETPTLAILSKRAPASVSGSPKFQHMEDQPLPARTTLSGGISDAYLYRARRGGTEPTSAPAT